MNKKLLTTEMIDEAAKALEKVSKKTPLQFNTRLSQIYKAKVYLKREDLQDVRSYKIRGAYNIMQSLTDEQKKHGAVCASAGNHAQGVAFSAAALKIHSTIFMPVVTPLQKVNKVRHFGKDYVTIQLVGKTFDESYLAAKKFADQKKANFVHPFDNPLGMAGQGTIAKEIFDHMDSKIDFVFCPVGGGGLVSGVGTYLKEKLPTVKIIGVEPKGAPSMYASLKQGKVVSLDKIDTFVDGAAVKTVGKNTFEIASKLIDKLLLVDEGQICTTMVELYQNEGIIAEPAGALSISALEQLRGPIRNKKVVCILSGGNNDIMRYPEIMEKSLVHQGLKHYFLINFAQKPGQLKQFVNIALGPTDDIVRFEYIKKTSKELGPALIGIELAKKEDLKPLLERMDKLGIDHTQITHSDLLYSYLI